MKFAINLTIFLILFLGLNAQSVKNEKVDLSFKNERILLFPDTVTTFSSNSHYLKLYGLEVQNDNPDLKLQIRKQAPYKYNVWKGSTKRMGGTVGSDDAHLSESAVLTIKDKNNELLIHRVYVNFDIRPSSESVKEIEPALFTNNAMSRQASYYFSKNYEAKQRFQFYYINKSTVHNDVNKGYELAINAVGKYNEGLHNEAMELFTQAIDIWKSTLAERDLSSKKARINRKVTEALYRNLIQSLIITERFNEATELIKSSGDELSGFYEASLGRYSYAYKLFEQNYRVKTSNAQLPLYDLELPKDLKPLNRKGQKQVPDNVADVNNLLIGSWRYFSITANGLPASTENFNVKDRESNLLGEKNIELLHLNPDGTKIDQEGSIDRTGQQDMDDPMPYWRAAKGPKGEYYLFFSYDKESLDNIEENFNQLEHAVVHSIDREKLVLRRTNYNPNNDASGYFIQLYRVGYLLD